MFWLDQCPETGPIPDRICVQVVDQRLVPSSGHRLQEFVEPVFAT